MRNLPSVELSRLPKLASSDLRLLWVNDWYEGPLEAVVEHRGGHGLMVLHQQDLASDSPYKWVVFELTPEQLEDEKTWHALYYEHVGEHWCFHGDAVVKHPPPRSDPAPSSERFVALHRERGEVDLGDNRAIGWTDELPKR
jgi:hypothetical protein